MTNQETRKIGLLESMLINAADSRSAQAVGRFIEDAWNGYTREGTIPGVGTVHYRKAPLDAEESLPWEMISAHELAQAHMYGIPENRLISSRGIAESGNSFHRLPSYIEQCVVYMPNNNLVLLVDLGSMGRFTKKMTEAHKEGKELVLDDKLYPRDWLLSLAHENNRAERPSCALELSADYASFNTDPNAFEHVPETRWLFGEHAGEYGRFLAEKGVKNFYLSLNPAELSGNEGNIFMRRLVMSGIEGENAGIHTAAAVHLPQYGVRTIVRTKEAEREYGKMRGVRVP